MGNEQIPKSEKWPTKSSLRLWALGTFVVGVVMLMFCIRSYFHFPHSGQEISQEWYKNLVGGYRMDIFIFTPLLAGWLICISVVMWLYSRKSKME
jgi:membrane protease YdiL (CAAX protease family)